MSQEPNQEYPEPTVGALILNQKGEMLLVRSRKWGDRLTIAGGHVEVGETLVDALRREIKEEVGIEIQDPKFLMVQEAIFSREFWKPRHFVFFDFVCQAGDVEPRVDGIEVQDFLWAEPSKALAMNLDSFTKRMIQRYLSEGGRA